MSLRVLFCVNGLGLGNSTRCHAILRALRSEGATVAVATSGNGGWYFRDREEVDTLYELEEVHYGSNNGKLSAWRTLASAGSLASIAWRNDKRLGTWLDAFRPDVALIDSVYSVWHLRRSGVPLVALNNADVVHVSYNKFTDRPRSIRAQFHLVEENDFRFHRRVPDAVISPCLDPALPSVGAPFRRVGPIVREGYTSEVSHRSPRRVLIMLSGSVFGMPVRLERAYPGLQIDVVGRERPDDLDVPEGITYHGRLRDNRSLLRDADLVLVNGGFSAVSEVFCMRKPAVVVPVPNHAEQWVNARTLSHLGVAHIGTEEKLEEAMLRALDDVPAMQRAYANLPPPADGARQAVQILQDVAGR